MVFLSVVVVLLSYYYFTASAPTSFLYYVNAIYYHHHHPYHQYHHIMETSHLLLDILGYKHKLLQSSSSTTTTTQADDDEEEPKFLKYSIFQGHSALRSLLEESSSSPSSIIILSDDTLSKSSKAILLLLCGYGGDVAHEVLLGVTLDSLNEAEYAATHRGQTNWTKEHPLDDTDDVVHSILHRIEGSQKGEGGHTGYENAKYWVAGGPKCYKTLTNSKPHKWKQALCQLAILKTPISVQLGVIVNNNNNNEEEGIYHPILSSGGKPPRQVFIPNNCWDPIRYIDLCCIICGSSSSTTSSKSTSKTISTATSLAEEKETEEEEERHQKVGLSLLDGRIDVTALRKELEWLHWMEIILLFLYEQQQQKEEDFQVEDIVEMCCKIKLPTTLNE